MINIKEPIEHVDGTPLNGTLSGHHYALTREDGLPFTREQYPTGDGGYFTVYVYPDGRVRPDGEPIIRNRNQKVGDRIEVNGKKPLWLRDEKFAWGRDKGFVTQRASDTKLISGRSNEFRDYEWETIRFIRLPKSHWAYDVINKGFEPWAGGEKPPEDWKDGLMLRRDGEIGHWHNWSHSGVVHQWHIVGYKKAAVPIQKTKEEWKKDWLKGMAFPEFLKLLQANNLVKEHPFTAETGVELTNEIKLAIKWGQENADAR